MKQQSMENTSYGKKAAFDLILSQLLGGSSYTINAQYEWQKPARVFSLHFSDEKSVRLSINLNTGADWLFHNCERRAELSLRCRAYYIAAYLQCLEAAAGANPQSYFSGLTALCAINSIYSRDAVVSFFPSANQRRAVLRPIDVDCAIRALRFLQINCSELLSSEAKCRCESAVNSFLTYAILPEISCVRNAPVYSLLAEIKAFARMTGTGKPARGNFPLFEENGMSRLLDMSSDVFTDACERSRNPFWTGAAIRLLAYGGNRVKPESHYTPSISESVCRFREDTIRYCGAARGATESLLQDNNLAVRRLSRMMDRAFPAVPSASGTLHYYE